MPWSTRFADPIVLPDGRQLITLKDAADYVTGLPKTESDLAQWQVAIEALMLCSRGGDSMLARIAFMRPETLAHLTALEKAKAVARAAESGKET